MRVRRFANHWVLRDIARRGMVDAFEAEKKALLFTSKNELSPNEQRVRSMFALQAMPKDAHASRVTNRCIESGKGYGVYSEYGLSRHRFKIKAMRGEIPGVEPSFW